MREQPLVRGLAQGEEEPDLAGVDGQAPAELRHPRGQQRGRALGPERQPDVGRADHLAGQLADRGPGLAADHRPAQLAHHGPEPAQAARAAEGAERLPHLLGDVLAELRRVGGEHPAHRLDALGRDRVAQLRPDREGRLQPLRAAPGLDLADAGGERRRLVQPQVGQPDRLGDLPALRVEHARVARRHDRVPGHVLGQVPVDRAAAVGQHVGELAQRVGELLRVAHRPERPHRPATGELPASGDTAAARAGPAATRAAGPAPAVFGLIGQAETERAISHRWLCGRMEGS